MTPPFRRVLVANRGEIALRIIRACHDMGMEAVAVYSDADARARHVSEADASIRLGPSPAAESYLRGDLLVRAALDSGAQAVHPGYGFLSERATFAAAVRDAGLVFVGPSPEVIAAIGDKLAARRLARQVGVPHVPGTLEPAGTTTASEVDGVIEAAAIVGYPLLVKAAAGGGGRGMRRVAGPGELVAALAAGSREAEAAFGDGAVYLEREIRPARHVEVQLLGDAFGRVVALGERDCSIQRRHQKLIEEAPAPGLSTDERRLLHGMAVRLGAAAGLSNAATCEFLRDRDGAFWFLEVNARLQVEHPVTELVTGVDLVAEQFRLAAGMSLSERVREAAEHAAQPGAHAIEVRISAEDPARDFAPAPGTITAWSMPSGPGVRVDTAAGAGDRVPPDYDPLIAKLIVYAEDRPAAIARLRRALGEVEIGGIQTTVPFHRAMMEEPAYVEATGLATTWVDDGWDGSRHRARAVRLASIAAGLAAIDEAGLGRAQSGAQAASGSPVPADHGWRATGRADALDRWPR